jgi:hypothetical protein
LEASWLNAAPEVDELHCSQLLGDQQREEGVWIFFERPTQSDEFNDIDTSLMALDHRHEALAFTDAAAYLFLGKAALLSGFNEKRDQASVRAIEDRTWHGRRPVIDRRTRYTENSRMQFFRISVGFTLALLGKG